LAAPRPQPISLGLALHLRPHRGTDTNWKYELYAIPLDGAGAIPRRLHPDVTGGEREAAVSPDGKWVAYDASGSAGAVAIYVQAFPGPGPKVQVSGEDGGQSPRWSRDGRELYYAATRPGSDYADGMYAVDMPAGAGLEPGVPRRLFHLRIGSTGDVTPDPNRFLLELAPPPSSTGSTMVVVTNWLDELRRRVPSKE
jgi:Tol biopolymer transport system component